MHRYISTPSKVVFLCLVAPFYLTYFACSCGYLCIQHRLNGKPIPFYCGNGHRSALKQWERQKALKQALGKEAPESLPARRKRALTIPNVSINASFVKRRKTTSSQQQSTFLGLLPLEVRERIYIYTLAGSEHIHLYRRADRRLGHYRCNGEHHQRCPPGLSWGCDQTLSGAWDVGRNPDRDRDDLLSLLMTCRRAYSEAIDLLYAHNDFCFPDAETVEYFTRTVLPKRLKLARRKMEWSLYEV